MASVGRLAAVAVVLVLAACGSSGSASRGAETAGRSTTTTGQSTTSSTVPSSDASEPSTSTTAGGRTPTTGPLAVTRVVDGDTVHVSNGQTVRLIGMDTPELVDPRKVVQCFAREASNRAHQLLDGATVTLEYDPTQGRTDKYGRTLAYIRTADGALYNLRMIADGYAHEYTYRLPYRYQDQFRAAERDARAHDRGLWSPTTCGGNTTAPVSSPPTTPQRSGCDPSYPTVCIPPPPPDLDCAQIPYRRFAVAGSDPHRFDSDHNDIGCETG